MQRTPSLFYWPQYGVCQLEGLHCICVAPEVPGRREVMQEDVAACLERMFCCERWAQVDTIVCCYSH